MAFPNKLKMKYSLLLLIVAITLVSCAKDEPEVPSVDEPTPVEETSPTPFSEENAALLDSIISDVIAQNPIPGFVVGVRSSTLGTYTQAFGVSNFSTQEPMNTNAVFGIGSVHKNFKWVTLHLLEKEGVLDLDDLVNTYVTEPDLPGVTLRHLMQHSSGLVDIDDSPEFGDLAFNDPSHEFSYAEMMAYLNNSNGSNGRFGDFENGRYTNDFVVGVNSAYSSYGPLIAAEVVKNITGQTMRELTAELIFTPLGLSATSHMGYDPDPELLAPGHANFTTVSPFFPDAEHAMSYSSAHGGAIHTDVDDLLIYAHSQFTDPEFLSQETIDALTEEHLDGWGMKAGLGVIQFAQWEDPDFWGHAGFGIRSHSTTMLHNKDQELTIVVFANIFAALDNDYQSNFAISEAIQSAFY